MAVLAFGVLGLTSLAYELTLLFTLLLLAARLSRLRIRLGASGRDAFWLAHIGLIGLIAITTGSEVGRSSDWISDARAFVWIGWFAAGEIVIQAWRARPAGGNRGMIVILCSAVTFLAGANTFDTSYVWFLAPAYFLCVIVSLLEFSHETALPIRRLGAVICGSAINMGVYTYRGVITEWGSRLLSTTPMPTQVGVPQTPVLGSSFDNTLNTKRALKIIGPLDDPHLRAAAFDTYTHGRWLPGMDARPMDDASSATLHSNAAGVRVHVERLERLDDLVFAPLNALGIDPGPNLKIEWTQDMGPIRTTETPSDQCDYDIIESAAQNSPGLLSTVPNRTELRRDLAVPSTIDPRVLDLARGIGRSARTPQEKIDAVCRYLDAHCTYSLRFFMGPGDPVSVFLLRRHTGQCQYFASAAVIMLRCLGVPSRYVTGYYAHESEGRGQIVVRQRDAHAWTECWIDGTGWVTVDATPAGGIPHASEASVPLWQRLREWAQDKYTGFRTWLARLGNSRLALAVIALVLYLLFSHWRHSRARRAGKGDGAAMSPPPELAALAARFNDRLSRADFPCPPNLPWSEHLGSALEGLSPSSPEGKASRPIDLQQARTFVRAYSSARFGGDITPAIVEQLGALLKDMDARPNSPQENSTGKRGGEQS
jgi:hypothetical protein